MESETVGGIVASALAMAAEAALKGTVGNLVKDLYKRLKEKVAPWGRSDDVDALEKEPGSGARCAVVAEVVDAQPADEQAAARKLAQELIAALKQTGPSVGLDMRRLEAKEVELGRITVTQKGGIGAIIDEVHLEGSFKAGDIQVGQPAKK